MVDDYLEGIEQATQFCDVRDLLSAWQIAADAQGGVPDHDAFLAGPGAPLIERLLVMSPVDGTMVYDRVGSTIVSLFGHDPTGRRLDEIDNPGIRPFRHRYVEAAAGDRPVFTIQHQVNLNSIGTNERLLLPTRKAGQHRLVVYVRSRGEQRDLMRAVFNASSDGINVLEAVRDADGTITDFLILAANAESARRMKLEPEAIVGRLLTDYFPFARTNGVLAHMIHAVEAQVRDVVETRYPMQGEIVERELRLVPNGDRLTVTNIDVGPHRAAARAVERHRNELLTANRLLACQAEDLRSANAALEETARELRAEIDRNRALEAELIRRARYDGLTDLPNRSYFESRFHEIVEDARKTGRRVALCILDVDHFKEINDRFGHNTGDVVLREISSRLTRTIRSTDIAGRMGGDEFAVLLIDAADADAARAAVDRMVAEVMRPLTVLRQDVPVSLSAGIAIFPQDAATETDLMAAADLAVYRAKRAGRGRPVFFEPEMRAEADRRTRLIRSLGRGVANGELRPHYQPLLDLRTGQLVGFEALARWHHPSEGILAPGHFAEAFDEPDLARAITAAMIDAVTSDLRSWSHTAVPAHVSINVTAFDLRAEGFAADLKQRLQHRGLTTGQMAVEVTETTVLSHDSERIAASLAELRALGFAVALDDFGTGYASLSHLVSLPCDTIKIDRSFVSGLGASPRTAAVVRSMVQLSAALGLDIVAEGVETRAELDAIRALDCHLVQGYLVSEPLPGDRIPAFVASFAPRPTALRTVLSA